MRRLGRDPVVAGDRRGERKGPGYDDRAVRVCGRGAGSGVFGRLAAWTSRVSVFTTAGQGLLCGRRRAGNAADDRGHSGGGGRGDTGDAAAVEAWRASAGAVHSAVGIITQVVLTDPERYAPKVEAELAVLLSYQYESGNWPSSLPPGKDRLVEVEHGAPGVVNCLVAIRECFPNLEGKIDVAIKKGRACIWERGLLTKEPCLCHGEYLILSSCILLIGYRHIWQRAGTG